MKAMLILITNETPPCPIPAWIAACVPCCQFTNVAQHKNSVPITVAESSARAAVFLLERCC